MEDSQTLLKLRSELYDELTGNILPYWLKLSDNQNGGFYGQVDAADILNKQADKGGILHARILWTFSSAYRLLGDERYLIAANHAADYLQNKFIDKRFGGVYWKLDYSGNPVETKKQIYNLGFAIYGLSEYYRATGNNMALEHAIQLFKLIELYSYDPIYEGYCEAFTREWEEIGDMRLSAKDANEKKTMNTHLHVLEAYTNLFRVWKSPVLKAQLIKILKVFKDKIIDKKTHHLGLFFDESWQLKSDTISFGHDIEAAWLLNEAALVTEDTDLIREFRSLVCPVVDAGLEGFVVEKGLAYEFEPSTSHTDNERHWWVQAEAVVGALEAYKISGDKKYLLSALSIWDYIRKNIIDTEHGEWFWSRLETGETNPVQDKSGFWKCPYHNSRMCMHVYEHFDV